MSWHYDTDNLTSDNPKEIASFWKKEKRHKWQKAAKWKNGGVNTFFTKVKIKSRYYYKMVNEIG